MNAVFFWTRKNPAIAPFDWGIHKKPSAVPDWVLLGFAVFFLQIDPFDWSRGGFFFISLFFSRQIWNSHSLKFRNNANANKK
jgi:hypothetical protein